MSLFVSNTAAGYALTTAGYVLTAIILAIPAVSKGLEQVKRSALN